MSPRGLFLVLDGPDGCGKTTQARMLAEAVRALGRTVEHLREPGSTPFGEALRAVLLAHGIPRGASAEVLTFFAARAQLLEECVEPALARGSVVVCERFVSSTYAYQAAGLGGALGLVEALESLVVRRSPDRLILLDLDERAALSRVARAKDGIESRGDSYHARVRKGFRDFAAARPYAALLDASGTRDAVHARVMAELRLLLEESAR